MGKDIRDPAGMNDEDLFEAFGLLDLHQQKLDKTVNVTVNVIMYVTIVNSTV